MIREGFQHVSKYQCVFDQKENFLQFLQPYVAIEYC